MIIGIAGRATGISAIDARYQWASNARPVREAQSSQMEAVFNENSNHPKKKKRDKVKSSTAMDVGRPRARANLSPVWRHFSRFIV